MLIWASHMIKQEKKIIVNFGSPYFAEDYFPEDKTFIDANNGPTPATIEGIVSGIFGEMEFVGKPVVNTK